MQHLVLETVDIDFYMVWHRHHAIGNQPIQGAGNAPLRISAVPLLQPVINLFAKSMAGTTGVKITQIETRKGGFVAQCEAVSSDLLGESIADNISVEECVILRLRFKGKYAHAPGFSRPDCVHANIGADIDEHLTG